MSFATTTSSTPNPPGSGRSHRPCLLILLLVGMSLQTGCASFGRFGRRDPLADIPRPRFSEDPQMEEVVDHLNRNVEKLHAWRANAVRIRANNMPLSGTLAVEEGNHLRLVVHSIAGNEVDMGSNNDVFWIWAKRMEPNPYIYCRHDEIDLARQSLGIPFEPDWLMQALGVAPLDTKDLVMQIDRTSRKARLVQTVMTAHGYPIQKVMSVDLVHGVIREHSVCDSAGRTIALAHLDQFHRDKHTGVVIPRRVTLDWPQYKMSLVMQMDRMEINPASIPSQIWAMPQPPGVQMVDLAAEAKSGIRYAERDSDPSVELMDPEEATADADTPPLRVAEQPPRTSQSARAAQPSQAQPRKNRADLVSPLKPVQFDSEATAPPKTSWEED